MIEAVFWGALGASALLVGALVAYAGSPNPRLVAVVMALGSGVLIGSVSFSLIESAVADASVGIVGLWTLIGAAAFTVGNWWFERRAGDDESKADQTEGSALSIVLGTVLDGLPESFVLGVSVLSGGVSIPLFAGVVLSNLPEGMSASAGLRVANWTRRRVVTLWAIVIAASAIAAAAGYVIIDNLQSRSGSHAEAFAAGALLAMVSNTLLPEAFKVEGAATGWLVAVGFAVALILAGV